MAQGDAPAARVDPRLQPTDDVAHKRLILSHHKDRSRGDFLIDDSEKNGAGEVKAATGGELVRFGPKGDYPDWPAVMAHMRGMAAKG